MIVSNVAAASFTASDAQDVDSVRLRLSELYPDYFVVPRVAFKLAHHLVAPVREDKKKTTIRYTKNTLEYPENIYLPMYDVHGTDQGHIAFAGTVEIVGLCYKPFGSLDEVDASHDGFASAHELKQQLCEFYGAIDDSEIVSIFAISPNMSESTGMK